MGLIKAIYFRIIEKEIICAISQNVLHVNK